jgi:hypothetical protein
VKIQHDGESATAWVENVRSATVRARAARSGRVFFWTHSDHEVHVSRVAIEGKPLATSLEGARARWVAAQVDALVP